MDSVSEIKNMIPHRDKITCASMYMCIVYVAEDFSFDD